MATFYKDPSAGAPWKEVLASMLDSLDDVRLGGCTAIDRLILAPSGRHVRGLRSQLALANKRGDVTLRDGDGHLVGIASTFGRAFDIHAS